MLRSISKITKLFDAGYRRKIFWLQIVMFFVAITDLIGVVSVVPFVRALTDPAFLTDVPWLAAIKNALSIDDRREFLLFLGGTSFVILTVSNIVNLINNWLLNKVSSDLSARLSIDLFANYLRQPYLFHVNHHSSFLTSRVLQETHRLAFKVILPALQINAKVISIAILSVTIIWMNPWVALASLSVFSGAYFIIYALVKAKLYRNSKIESEDNQERIKLVGEGLAGIKEIKLLHLERVVSDKYVRPTERYFHAIAVTSAISMAPHYILETIAFGSVIGGLLVAIAFGYDFQQMAPLLSFYVMAAYKLIPALQRIFSSLSSMKGAATAFEALQDDLVQSFGSAAELPSRPDRGLDSSKVVVSKRIQLTGIDFVYPGTDRPVLSNLSFSIAANTSVGLVGPSGAGKSTIVDLLLGLLTPSAGVLTVDDTPVTPSMLQKWQASIGYVPQSIFLAEGTIAENIAFGYKSADIDAIKLDRAVKAANLDEFISSCPAGLQTMVGERGVKLSGGQRQRIGIARAMYEDPVVLVFDEATSALDSMSEEVVMSAIRDLAKVKTVILIAHRITTVRHCDKIFVLEAGNITSHGTFDELMRQSETFRSLARGTR